MVGYRMRREDVGRLGSVGLVARLGLPLTAVLMACQPGSDPLLGDRSTGGTAGAQRTRSAPGGQAGHGGHDGAGERGGAAELEPAAVTTALYDFDDDVEGFGFNRTATPPPYVNLAAPGASDSSGTALSRGWDSRDAHDAIDSGSLRIDVTFTGWKQHFMVEVDEPVDTAGNPLDLSERVLRAMVYVEQPLSPDPNPGGLSFYIKTGDRWAWGATGWRDLTIGRWMEVEFDTSQPAADLQEGYDPAAPRTIGIEFTTAAGSNEGPYDDGPMSSVIYIDALVMLD